MRREIEWYEGSAAVVVSSRIQCRLPSAELPGSLEWQRERDWSKTGIPLADMHVELLTQIADDLNLTVPWEK